ncbi:MAG TPA: preprotein translocase subunit YajC [Bryobacteraceae bacterium]|nr:preprotein translocase subunit YajC [Bryobacteraceae bacterium]
MTPGLILLQASPLGNSSNPALNFLPIVLIFGIFYFLLLRPMQKQRKEQQQLLANLQNGQVITSTGGVIGTIVSLTDTTVTIRVKPDNVKLLLSRSAVSGLAPDELK